MKQERVVIENMSPQLECGTYFIKRIVGEPISVLADVLGDGHDVIQADVAFKHESEKSFSTVRMEHLGNDVHSASFTAGKQGFYEYKVEAWVDNPLNWQHGIEAKLRDHQTVTSELLDGVQYLNPLLKSTKGKEKEYVQQLISAFEEPGNYNLAVKEAISEKLHRLFIQYPLRTLVNSSTLLKVYVDREKARFSTWYEFFPRSTASVEGAHGTFKDAERLLPKISAMGFDTVYLPPIHPIGEVNRKGKNNATAAQEGDTGVPWGIGSRLGGHKSIHPELGTEADFKGFIKTAAEYQLEVAMDLA
ncbi:maltotransferase domain-containing protein, partial [Muriicola sp.]|uniref:maltotransferase domain-containing protein n=1 Tax=Muriicola sp. TaxID=2020856 RepID=UPI003C762736